MTSPVPEQAITDAESYALNGYVMWLLCASRSVEPSKITRDQRRQLITIILEHGAPAIRRQALAGVLPACPGCGCTLPADPDDRECGCDDGCNDGPYPPGVNALIAAERDRIRKLAADYGALYPETREDTYGGEYDVGVPFEDLITASATDPDGMPRGWARIQEELADRAGGDQR